MRKPSILISYPGPDSSGMTIDVYMYLRPETNGVETESVMMRTITGNPLWRSGVKLIYLANYPGDFVQTLHIVERHYDTKIAFARAGGAAFTPGMRADFEAKFGVPFEEDRVLGAFAALETFDLDEETLFAYRVDEKDMLVTLGQNVKKWDERWIVNYDIPAILHRNSFKTDIAVMVFRLSLEWEDFMTLVDAISRELVKAGVLAPDMPPSRVFHYSRSPFEQFLDGIGFLYGVGVSEDSISFARFLIERGYAKRFLFEAVRHPLVTWRDEDGVEREGNLLELTSGMTYFDAFRIWKVVTGHLRIP